MVEARFRKRPRGGAREGLARGASRGGRSGPGPSLASEPRRTLPHDPGPSNRRREKKSGPTAPRREDRCRSTGCGREKFQATGFGSAAIRIDAGRSHRRAPLPAIMPIRRTVMVPPAKRANSESNRPQSGPEDAEPDQGEDEPDPAAVGPAGRGDQAGQAERRHPEDLEQHHRDFEDAHRCGDWTRPCRLLPWALYGMSEGDRLRRRRRGEADGRGDNAGSGPSRRDRAGNRPTPGRSRPQLEGKSPDRGDFPADRPGELTTRGRSFLQTTGPARSDGRLGDGHASAAASHEDRGQAGLEVVHVARCP